MVSTRFLSVSVPSLLPSLLFYCRKWTDAVILLQTAHRVKALFLSFKAIPRLSFSVNEKMSYTLPPWTESRHYGMYCFFNRVRWFPLDCARHTWPTADVRPTYNLPKRNELYVVPTVIQFPLVSTKLRRNCHFRFCD